MLIKYLAYIHGMIFDVDNHIVESLNKYIKIQLYITI